MITKNFKALVASTLLSAGSNYGYLPIHDVTGRAYHLALNYDRYPYSRDVGFVTGSNTAGISLGRGNAAESDDWNNLQSTITSGISVQITNDNVGYNSPGNPYHMFRMTITNTTDSPITISEVGFKQRVRASNGPGRSDGLEVVILLDRTVLSTPITIAGRDAGVVVYKLQTAMNYPTVEDIPMVPFSMGSDSQIADMIDAAQLGLIDLQEDAGWKVSDRRKISIAAFTDDLGTSYPAQNIEIAIASFADYNECGCVIQFDFMQALTVQRRLRSSNSTAGGYENTEYYTDLLPHLVDAMPEWIKTRLKTFMVKSWNTSTNSIVEVEGNKLALRARVEMFGNGNIASDAEGSVIPLYQKFGNGTRAKSLGYSGSSSFHYFLRTPYSTTTQYAVYYSGSQDTSSLNTARGIVPFGCM